MVVFNPGDEPRAYALRLHFTGTDLPAGAELMFDAPDAPFRAGNAMGRNKIVETHLAGHKVRALVPAGLPLPEGKTRIRFDPEHTQIYADGWIVE